MNPSFRIKYDGVNVRLVGWGFKKNANLVVLKTGIASIKERLAKGIGENDAPTKPLSKKYARYKSFVRRKRAVRDLDLTGQLLDSIKPRYADDSQALADAGTRLGRMKARKYRNLLQFSERDQAAMMDRASSLFAAGVQQSFQVGRAPGRASAESKSAIQARRTYFGRTDV